MNQANLLANAFAGHSTLLGDALIGVIDLRRGEAVHGIAGNRDKYAAIPFVKGDAIRLSLAYVHFGLRRLYVADLDAIENASAPSGLIERIADTISSEANLFVDVGWRGNEDRLVRQRIESLARSYGNIHWIATAETALAPDAVEQLSRLVGSENVWVGLDYSSSRWMSRVVSEADWLTTSERAEVRGAIVLDLSSVGTCSGPITLTKCRELASRFPNWRLVSGGGVRNATDLLALMASGCEGCLIATAIQPHLARCADTAS